MKRLVFSVLLSSVCFISLRAAPATRLRVGEGFVNPVGYHDAMPVFSWQLPDGVKKQTHYRLEVESGGRVTWDSGWVESDQSVFVPYGGARLGSRERVRWRVNVRADGKKREFGWSEYASLEVGLLASSDWSARWIRPSQKVNHTEERVASLRRKFAVSKPIVQARLYVTARGVFLMQLNGARVGRDYFANGFTSYPHRVDTLTYDVTRQVRSGDNELAGLLGTGWYAGRLPFETKEVGPYGQDPALLAQLELTYADGTKETVPTDDRWAGTYEGPILSSSLYDGEIQDARRQAKDWAPVVVEAELGKAVLTPKPFAPVRATQVLKPQNITQPQPGRHVFDLGQNMVGWARLRIPVKKDATITVRYAEMLQADGTLYTLNYRTAKSVNTYTAAADGMLECEPHFTFHGFRYVEISGVAADAVPQKNWVAGVVLHSDLPVTGRFTSSHAKLNQLQSNIAWGWRGNSLDIPTDCPQRDERMGWTGDAQAFGATSMFLTDAHAFWKSWLGSMRDDQFADGGIPAIIPNAMEKWQIRSPGWMDAATIIPWDVYVRTGDIQVIADNYAMMQRLVGWYRSQAVDGLIPRIGGFGDWLQPYPQPKSENADQPGAKHGDTPRSLLGTAFYAQSVRILSDAAAVLRKDDDVKRYAAELAGVRAAFTRHYFDADGKLQNAPETQTAYVLAIVYDLIPAELKPKAGAQLVRLVGEAGGHLRTGFLGTPGLAAALDETGHADVAAELLFRDTYPSWFYPIGQGATTMWERWNSYTHESGFGDPAMNSFNHYAYGAIGQWMYERVAGLAPDPEHAGYKHFFVRPLIVSQLDSAAAELETPYGKASSGWKRSGEKIVYTIVVPPNTTATVTLPDGSAPLTLATGTHRLESRAAARR